MTDTKALLTESEKLSREIHEKKCKLADLANEISAQEKIRERNRVEILRTNNAKEAELADREHAVKMRENKAIELEMVLSEREKNLVARETNARADREKISELAAALKKEGTIIQSEKDRLARESADIESKRKILIGDIQNFTKSRAADLERIAAKEKEADILSENARSAVEAAKAAEERYQEQEQISRSLIDASMKERKELAARFSEIQKKENEITSKDQELISRVSEIAQREKELSQREEKLIQRERSLIAFREEVFKSANQRGVKIPEGL